MIPSYQSPLRVMSPNESAQENASLPRPVITAMDGPSTGERRERHIESIQRHGDHAIESNEMDELRRCLLAKQSDGLLIGQLR